MNKFPNIERRVALKERQRVSEMSPEQLRQELLTCERDYRIVVRLMKQGYRLLSRSRI